MFRHHFIVLVLAAAFVACTGQDNQQKESNDSRQGAATNAPAGLIASLSDSIESNPASASLYHRRSIEYLRQSMVNEALRDINEALELSPDNPAYLITLSEVYFALNQPQKTRQTLLKVLDVDGGNTEAMLKIAELNLYFRDYVGVNSYANRAINADPAFAQAYFIKAFAAKEQGDTAEAIKQFQLTIDKAPDHYEALVQLGVLYAGLGNPIARDYYNRALELNPKSIEVLYNLGMYYQGSEQYNKAMDTYNRIIEIDPTFKMSYYNLGYIHLAYLGVYDEAAKHFTRALQADPNYVQAYYNRGYCLELMGDVINARKDYQKALQLQPNYPLAVEGLNRLDRIESIE